MLFMFMVHFSSIEGAISFRILLFIAFLNFRSFLFYLEISFMFSSLSFPFLTWKCFHMQINSRAKSEKLLNKNVREEWSKMLKGGGG